MVSSVAYNPVTVTNGAGSFTIESSGYIVGVALDDPSVRNWLAGGVLATSETLPMWGGVAISEAIPGLSGGPVTPLGSLITRAASLTSATNPMTGFSVYNQDHAMIASPSSPAPVAVTGGDVHFYRFGSRARIPVPCSAAFASLRGGPINAQVSWDFVNQQLTTYQASYAANVITASSWAATNGGQGSFTTTSAHGVGVGQYVTISGEVPTGYNGTWLTVTGTTGSTLVVAMPVNPGTSTTQGTLVAGGGALAVKVLDLNIGNSMSPVYNATTGACTWNYVGSAALLEI